MQELPTPISNEEIKRIKTKHQAFVGSMGVLANFRIVLYCLYLYPIAGDYADYLLRERYSKRWGK